VKPCVIIPCFDHIDTVAAVADAAQAYCPVLVVDDGSKLTLPEMPGVTIIRLAQNSGKGAALRAGFQRAVADGFTHAITMDADGQHQAADLPKFLAAVAAQPDAFIVGVRDFHAAGCPAGRRRSNAVSTFWFRVESGVRLGDTQCGFRCYPLALTQKLRATAERYAFELEFMVRAAWTGTPIVAVPVACTYSAEQMRQSHFRPVVDLTRITTMNIGLVAQSWCVPRSLRSAWSVGERPGFGQTIRDFFAEHAHEPARLACAVGLGLFCGIAPIWGFQMLVAATLAHLLRLNKAVTLLASNVSIPPFGPLFIVGGLLLGHWMFTGQSLRLPAGAMTYERAIDFAGKSAWEWCVGSVLLGVLVATMGTVTTYGVAKFLRHR
jgi:uncharacterized protein (DUF2062 family)